MKTLLALPGAAILMLTLLGAGPALAQANDADSTQKSDAANEASQAWRPTIRAGTSGGLGFDSNPGNAESGQTVPATGYVNLQATAASSWDTSRETALLLRASVEGQQYFRYTGLSNVSATLKARELYRPGNGFYVPTFSAWASASAIGARSSLRSGAEYHGGVAVAQQVTTVITVVLGGNASERSAGSDSMKLRFRAATLDADWQLGEQLSSHLGYEYRSGSFATSSPADPGALLLSTARQTDDTLAIAGTPNVVYRLNGYAHIATAGLNYALTPSLALDAQAQKIHTQADGGDHYDRWLVELSLLKRF